MKSAPVDFITIFLSSQVKFSELTLDMFRMLQTLEREPQEELNNQIYDASPATGHMPFVSKFILVNQSINHLTYIALKSSAHARILRHC